MGHIIWAICKAEISFGGFYCYYLVYRDKIGSFLNVLVYMAAVWSDTNCVIICFKWNGEEMESLKTNHHNQVEFD